MTEAEQRSDYPATAGAEENHGVSPPTATAADTLHSESSSSSSSSSAGPTAVDKEEKSTGAEEAKQQRQEDEEQELVIEQPLLTIKEVFVYRVPPLRAASGHRAEEWGLANPVFTGVLKMAQVGNACCLRLFKPPPEGELGAVPELFSECEVRLDSGRTLQVYVESVIDSSRYFVLRCEDKASGRHAYVGVGFRERSSAFDFKAVLDDFVRFLDRQKRAEETSAVVERRQEDGGGDDALGPVKPIKDLSIAEGQKVHIALKVGSNGGGNGSDTSRARRRPRGDAASKAATQGDRSGLLLAPPPLPGVTYKGGLLAAPPPISPQAASGTTPETAAGEPPAAAVVGATPPTVTSPTSEEAEEEPPDSSPDTASVTAAGGGGSEVGTASAGRGGDRGRGGGGGGDDDDDDGWGEFESA